MDIVFIDHNDQKFWESHNSVIDPVVPKNASILNQRNSVFSSVERVSACSAPFVVKSSSPSSFDIRSSSLVPTSASPVNNASRFPPSPPVKSCPNLSHLLVFFRGYFAAATPFPCVQGIPWFPLFLHLSQSGGATLRGAKRLTPNRTDVRSLLYPAEGRGPRVPRVRDLISRQRTSYLGAKLVAAFGTQPLKHLPVLTVQFLRALRALCGFSPFANQRFDFHRFPTSLRRPAPAGSPSLHSNHSLSFHLLLRSSTLFYFGGAPQLPNSKFRIQNLRTSRYLLRVLRALCGSIWVFSHRKFEIQKAAIKNQKCPQRSTGFAYHLRLITYH
jgi:hypothetical protein